MEKNKNQQNMFEANIERNAPLAQRMRPKVLKDFVGQQHVVKENSILHRAIIADKVGSCIFWGPPGTGKTTLAGIIANSTNSHFVKLNAVSSGVADAKKVIEDAKKLLETSQKKTYLLLDECHRWSKAQSDCVLGAVEEGIIYFIGSTTENPYVSLTPAIVSRCRVFEFFKLSQTDVKKALVRAVEKQYKGKVEISEEALDHFAWVCAGDLRSAYNGLELAFLTTVEQDGKIKIDKQIAEESIQKKALSVDENTYYDMISAFCKSLRGSDSTAALFWFARLIKAGCDPMLLARRLVVHSSEDVGIADNNALVVAVSALHVLKNVGMPEARIPLAQAIITVCQAPKSNLVVEAIAQAYADADRFADSKVPDHLTDGTYKKSTDHKKQPYLYPHDFGGWVEQQYLPDEMQGIDYIKKNK